MRAFALWLVLALLVCPLGLATVLTGQTLSGVTLNATGSGTALVVSGVDVYADLVRVANDSISLQNASYERQWGNFSILLLNFTTAGGRVYSYQFPNISSSAGNEITVLNGLSQDLGNVQITVGTNGLVPSTPRLTYPGGGSELPAFSYNSTSGTVVLSVESLPQGTSTLALTPSSVAPAASGGGGGGNQPGGEENATETTQEPAGGVPGVEEESFFGNEKALIIVLFGVMIFFALSVGLMVWLG